jgi:hypothetical protein
MPRINRINAHPVGLPGKVVALEISDPPLPVTLSSAEATELAEYLLNLVDERHRVAVKIPLALRREIEALEQVADVRNWGPPEMAEWNSAVAALCAKVEALMLDASVGMGRHV